MDNYAKILMKKPFLTLIVAFATLCGFAQESISNLKFLLISSIG